MQYRRDDETAREKAETDSFDESGKVYNKLQEANKIIAKLVSHLEDSTEPMSHEWVSTYVNWRAKALELAKRYGDINGE